MSSNNRIFYACQAVSINNEGSTSVATGDMAHGVQSVGMTTNFNLEQAFELAQIEIYENIEGTPDVEVTLEKVIDGHPLIYHMASTGVAGTANSGLAARSDVKCDVRLGIFDAQANNVASAEGAGTGTNPGDAEVEVYCSGMFISSVSYTIPVDGNATESVTLVGNNKQWLTGTDVLIKDGDVAAFNGTDTPKAFGEAGAASGGIQRREDVILSGCILPTVIDGVVGSGYGNAANSDGTPRIHIQNFTCSTDFSREDILELGRKTPYFRPANFPIEVTCEIEAITTSGDFVSAYEFGDSELYSTVDSGNNVSNEVIFMFMRGGLGLDLGNKNKLSSVSYGGGDAGGGNVSCTYSFSNFNQLDVQDRLNQQLLGFGGITLGAGFDSNGLSNDRGSGPFPADLVANL
tara:strand:+ start:10045 stop:11259 length:1215 start_codon:yes stop_codon:yes gene_type:complete